MSSNNLVSYNRQIYNLFCDIQDIIGSKKDWPRRILAIFWSKKSAHWERKLLAAFLYVNGLNPVIFQEWATLRQNDVSDTSDIMQTLQRFEFINNNYKIYAWNVSMRRYEYLSGKPHLYQKRL